MVARRDRDRVHPRRRRLAYEQRRRRPPTAHGRRYEPNWSPDGKEIVVTDGISAHLCTVSVADGRVHRLPTGRRRHGRRMGSRSCSCGVDRAGRPLAREPRRHSLRRLAKTPVLEEDAPSWLPDGTQVAFTAMKHQCGRSRLFVMNADGTGRRWLGVVTNSAPSWQQTSPGVAPATAGSELELRRRGGDLGRRVGVLRREVLREHPRELARLLVVALRVGPRRRAGRGATRRRPAR